MSEPISEDARERAAQEIAIARVHGGEVFTATSAMFGILSGGEGDMNVHALDALRALSIQVNTLTMALTDLVGQDLVDEAEAALNKRREEVEQARGGKPADMHEIFNRIAANGRIIRIFNQGTSRLTITAEGQTHRWSCPDPLLGKAIDEVYRRHLGQGETLFLGDKEERTDGVRDGLVYISPSAHLEWEHDLDDTDDVTAVAAQVEDHVQRFGGILLDGNGNLLDQDALN